MRLQLRVITDTVTLMTTTTTKILSIRGEQNGPFGGIESEWQLDVWQDGADNLRVRLSKNGKKFAEKTFRDCETQHSDSERWVNDQVKYPNPFAGFLLHRIWEG